MDTTEFTKNWTLETLPTALEKLIYFQENISDCECYSQGFSVFFAEWLSYNDDPEFCKRILYFAQANGSGSNYAIWDDETGKPVEQMPIVVFGDEGGVHIVAKNFLQLLHLLTYDTEISVSWDDVYFYHDDEDDYEESPDLDEFLHWLKEDYGLDQIQSDEEANQIITAAKEKYQAAFDEWFKKYDRSSE